MGSLDALALLIQSIRRLMGLLREATGRFLMMMRVVAVVVDPLIKVAPKEIPVAENLSSLMALRNKSSFH